MFWNGELHIIFKLKLKVAFLAYDKIKKKYLEIVFRNWRAFELYWLYQLNNFKVFKQLQWISIKHPRFTVIF